MVKVRPLPPWSISRHQIQLQRAYSINRGQQQPKTLYGECKWALATLEQRQLTWNERRRFALLWQISGTLHSHRFPPRPQRALLRHGQALLTDFRNTAPLPFRNQASVC